MPGDLRQAAAMIGTMTPAMTPATLAETMLSPWLALPLAGLTMLIVGAHVLSVQVSAMPRFRKRVRIANGLIMMFVTAALGYALAGVPLPPGPEQHPEQWGGAGAFVLVWMVIVALLTVVVALAVVDALGVAGWGLRSRRAIRLEFRETLAADAARRAGSAQDGGGGDARG